MSGRKVELGLIVHAHFAIVQGLVEFAQQRQLRARRLIFAIGMEPPGPARALGEARGVGSLVGLVGRVSNVGRRDPEGQRQAEPAPGHLERAVHHRPESGQQLFKLVERERAGPCQRAGVDPVARPCRACDPNALDQTAQNLAEVALAHRQFERIEIVDPSGEDVSIAGLHRTCGGIDRLAGFAFKRQPHRIARSHHRHRARQHQFARAASRVAVSTAPSVTCKVAPSEPTVMMKVVPFTTAAR